VNAYAITSNVQLNKASCLKIAVNWKLIRILSIVFIVLFFAFYLYQVNAEISERYSIQQYQKSISEFSKENKVLEINSAKLGSLDNIVDSLEGLGFEKAGKVHYIQVLDTHVVAK